MQISSEDFFKLAPEYAGKYSKFGEDGIPTHDMEGNELTKSAKKKLKGERSKHEKALMKWKKQQEKKK